ncbi:MAG: DUF362 domain-containing protein [Oscillospiraceae bacterium]|nr:DUF362 domain-containing protein [Oscillospiraceae bacterium]
MEKRVFIAKCDDYEQEKVNEAIGRVLDAYGGAEAILKNAAAKRPGLDSAAEKDPPKVLVKPNLLMPRKPDGAVTTHPSVVEAVCKAFIKAGADVSIIDSTGGPHTRFVLGMLYGKTGIKQAAENSGAKLSYNTKSQKVTYPEGRILEKSELLLPVLEADLVISLAKVKTHGFQAMTGAVKNLFGTIPGMDKPLLHRKFPKREDFAKMLVDICQKIKPGFCITDGVIGMEGPGPAGGDPKHLGVIIGGISPYAADLAQCYLMGLRTDSVYTLAEAKERDLAPIDPLTLDWLGDDYAKLRQVFKPAKKHKDDNPPKILENCIGCGECKRICPMQCIKMDGKSKMVCIDEKNCIRCYCCHEFCPAKAISLT